MRTYKLYQWLTGISLLLVITTFGCKEPETYGYLSDTVRYINNPWEVPLGGAVTSSPLTTDNSTFPMEITLTDVKDSNGKHADAFYKKYLSSSWKEAYDPTTDTDLDKINAKRQTDSILPIKILPVTGQVVLNQTTRNIPKGDYQLDMHIKNPSGEKDYKNLMTLRFVDPQYYIIGSTPPYFMALPANSETAIPQPYTGNWIDNTKGIGSNIEMSIKRISVTQNQIDFKDYSRIILKILDKNGKPFPGKAIVDRASNLNNLKKFAQKVIVNEESVTYEFGLLPIPADYWEKQTNGYLNYFRIYDQYIASYDSIIPASWAPPQIPQYVESKVNPIKINIRFELRIYEPGDWEVTLKLRVKSK